MKTKKEGKKLKNLIFAYSSLVSQNLLTQLNSNLNKHLTKIRKNLNLIKPNYLFEILPVLFILFFLSLRFYPDLFIAKLLFLLNLNSKLIKNKKGTFGKFEVIKFK